MFRSFLDTIFNVSSFAVPGEKENHEETMEQSNAVLIQSVESTAEKSQDSGNSYTFR